MKKRLIVWFINWLTRDLPNFPKLRLNTQIDQKSLQQIYINWLTKGLFNSITEEDIVQIKGDNWFVRGKPLADDRIEKLRADAQVFHDSTIWHVLRNELRNEANKRMYLHSRTTEDILAGKMMLYVIHIVHKTLRKLSNV